jgi:RNA polymerase sigma factor (sigma-70 family)
MDDRELLAQYAGHRSQDAFRQLVERHLPMVYSVAHRVVRDPQLAEEIAQSVFTTLAQKAEVIQPLQVVGGWLYNTTRNLSRHAVRSEQRRREREQTAASMQALELSSDDGRISEHLESGLTLYSAIKVGEEWKLHGNTRGYAPNWETEGTVENFVP